MKKKLSILLAACSIFTLAGCTVIPAESPEPTVPASVSEKTPTPPKYSENTPAPTASETTPKTEPTATTVPTPTPEPTATTAPTPTSEPKGVTIEESIIYNEGGIVITVKGFDKNSIFGPQIKLLVENNSDKNIAVQTRKSSINGYMASFLFSCEVAVGKKSNDTLTIQSSELKDCGITTITDIEFSLHIFCSDDWNTIADSDMIHLQTSAASSYVQQYDDSGITMYDENGIKVIAKGIVDKALGPALMLYVENNTEHPIAVQSRDTSINGFMISTLMSIEVRPGKKAVDTMSFMNSSLKDNDITKITEIETVLHFFDPDSWTSRRNDSNPITITFE